MTHSYATSLSRCLLHSHPAISTRFVDPFAMCDMTHLYVKCHIYTRRDSFICDITQQVPLYSHPAISTRFVGPFPIFDMTHSYVP